MVDLIFEVLLLDEVGEEEATLAVVTIREELWLAGLVVEEATFNVVVIRDELWLADVELEVFPTEVDADVLLDEALPDNAAHVLPRLPILLKESEKAPLVTSNLELTVYAAGTEYVAVNKL